MTVYMERAKNRTGQKVDGSLAPNCLYSAEARLPDLIFGSVGKAQQFASTFEEVNADA